MPTPQFGWQPHAICPHAGVSAVHDVGPVGKGAHERNRKPVAHRLAEPGLILHVVREMRKRVPLGVAPFIGDRLRRGR